MDFDIMFENIKVGELHEINGIFKTSLLSNNCKLAIARGLMSHPKILLLDEPSLGLAPIIVNQVFDLIQQIRDTGVTIMLVEQNANKALKICDYAYVLETGNITMTGTGKELLASDDVRKAYLGG